MAEDRVHTLTAEAPASRSPWAQILSWDSLRYQKSGWWVDAVLPHEPVALLVFAFALPLLWAGVGYAITPDRASYLDTHDVTYQIPFFALHVLALRVTASLWGRGLSPALDGLGVDAADQAKVKKGFFGPLPNLGALACGAYFIYRDTFMGLWPKLAPTIGDDGALTVGRNAFDDPDMWDFGSLGRPVHGMMLGLWHLEWLIFGYLLWTQVWSLFSIARAFKRTDFRPHLSKILVEDLYRPFFTLLGRASTVLMVFALGNLAFIHETGELFPRDSVTVGSVDEFLLEMSDLLSTTLMFVFVLVGIYVLMKQLRTGLTRAVNALFAEAGDHALVQLAEPLVLSGDAAADLPKVHARVEAQAGVIRAIAFQREVDTLGGRTLLGIVFKAIIPLATAGFRILKMKGGGGGGGDADTGQ
jgi:hypothetical protein